MIDISVIVPVCNERENIPILHRQIVSTLKGINKNFEIIYIDDGSTDGSLEVLEQIKKTCEDVRLISFDKNYGKTSAIDAGFRSVRGEFILTIDSDLQYDARDLVRVFYELKNSDAVIGYRTNRRQIDGNIKYITSKIANYVRRMIVHEKFRDTGCFLAGYKKACIDGIFLCRGFQIFLPSLLEIRGYRVREIDVKIYPRKYGKSHYNIRNRLFKNFLALLAVRYMKSRKVHYKVKYVR